MMLPPTQLRDGRTYGSENLRSAMQKDFFDSIDPFRKLTNLICCDAQRGLYQWGTRAISRASGS